jgi:2'-5' RNA ligase
MSPEDPKVRLFIGAQVSMGVVRDLTETVDQLSDAASEAGLKVRWVSPANYHVTVKFLGWGRPEVIDAIRDVVGEALRGQRAFSFRTAKLGAFPDQGKARVLWAGVEGDGGRLAALAKTVDVATASLGFPTDKRDFHPHVTIGRLRKVANCESLLLPYAEQAYRETSVQSLVLFESVIKSTGSEYHVRAEWPLEGGSKGSKRQTKPLKEDFNDARTGVSGDPETQKKQEQQHGEIEQGK